MSVAATLINSPVSVTASELIALNKKVRGLSLRTRIISALQSGDYQSAFKGRGMEYDESRLYQPGDDIRNIDWRVTARSGKTHTKLFREEREQPVHLWIDLRSPMFFATRGRFKSVRVAELASLLAWIAINQGDRVGGIIFDDEEHHELKPQRGKSAVLRMINTITRMPGWQKKSFTPTHANRLDSLLNLRRLVKPGSLVILLSDFRGYDEQSRTHLLGIRRHSEMIMMHLYDLVEEALPPDGIYRLSNGSDELQLDTGDDEFRQHYEQRFRDRQKRLIMLARRCHFNYITCRTDEEPEFIIREGLKQR
ncbi:MAG: DUF58 domain-containing protein [Pseudomonadota bacterium]